MKTSWPEFPKGTTTPDGKKQEGGQGVVEIDYEDQHLQGVELMKEIAGKYDEWLAARGVEEVKRVEMLARRDLLVSFAREELGIYV